MHLSVFRWEQRRGKGLVHGDPCRNQLSNLEIPRGHRVEERQSFGSHKDMKGIDRGGCLLLRIGAFAYDQSKAIKHSVLMSEE